jgi:DNA repair exonuclease SbcCD nuclease subunit
MKILFTADWHIKLGTKNIPGDWAKARYFEFFKQVKELSQEVDMHIIGGDMFDRVPTIDELELYFSFIREATVPTLLFDGNHEATKKHATFLKALKSVTEALNPLAKIITEVTEFEFGTILPYCELHKKDIFKYLNSSKPLFTHVRGAIPPHVKPEVDLDLFDPFPVVFAGDLHSHGNTQQNIVYPGSPMTTSFHRSLVETGYLIIEAETFVWDWQKFNLPQLIRKTVSNPAEMVPTPYHHTIYELEGDIAELAEIKNSELLDKKVVRRSTEASLYLDNTMTIPEELMEYLLYILELPEDKAIEIIGTFNDYIKNT